MSKTSSNKEINRTLKKKRWSCLIVATVINMGIFHPLLPQFGYLFKNNYVIVFHATLVGFWKKNNVISAILS